MKMGRSYHEVMMTLATLLATPVYFARNKCVEIVDQEIDNDFSDEEKEKLKDMALRLQAIMKEAQEAAGGVN